MQTPIPYMSRAEIEAFAPGPLPHDTPLAQARRAMQATGCSANNQQMGMRWPIGCVALEVTQRCNLDCTLCYLSEHSEAVKDIALDELFRRIELIYRYYGPNTDVQITGGEPTLRRREELIEIVRRVRQAGMRPTLMTNGRRATRGLPISVMFNTTVHDGNFEEVPGLVRFFKAHAGCVRTASFQVQADTGRGV